MDISFVLSRAGDRVTRCRCIFYSVKFRFFRSARAKRHVSYNSVAYVNFAVFVRLNAVATRCTFAE